MKQYIIIEHFRKESIQVLYQRFNEKGRMLPEGVEYINSWIDEDVKTCYQLMQSESLEKINEWISYWDDLAGFEIVAVISSKEAEQKVLSI